jgi:glycosyltransferase involved in cell wall biosynthesis
MKLLHIITTIELGGAEKQLLILVRKQIEDGNRVSIVFLKGKPELSEAFREVGANVASHLANRPFLIQIFQLRSLIRSHYDLIHTHLPRAEVLTLLTFTKLVWITSRHNSESFLPNGNEFISKILSRLVLLRIERVVAISNAVKNFLLESKEVMDIRKLDVVRYGFDDETGNKTSARSIPNPDNSSTEIVSISRLVPQKDISTLLRAIKEIHSSKNFFLTKIYGEGPMKEELLEYSRALGISDRVQFLGKTFNVTQALTNADIFVLTSRYEGFGLVLLEAMQAGLPIVCCRNEATEEVLGPDYPGLVAIGDFAGIARKITELAQGKDREVAIDYLERRLTIFSPTIMWNELRSVYLKALSNS